MIVAFTAASVLCQFAGAEAAQIHNAPTHTQSTSDRVVVQSGARATLYHDSVGG
jgi:hypothetical protein